MILRTDESQTPAAIHRSQKRSLPPPQESGDECCCFRRLEFGRSVRATDPAIVKAREAVRNQLIDPDSAKFRNEETAEKGAVVCGEMNAKNRMGGYTGFAPYIHAAIASKSASIISPGSPDFIAYLRMEDSGSEQDMSLTHEVKNACDFVSTWELLCTERQKARFKDIHENCGLWLQGFETDVGMKQLRAKLVVP